jgi:hypothetical protein
MQRFIGSLGVKTPGLRVAAERVCLESTRENGKNAVQKMEAF